jgi:3'-phosphoadenosine 5'-phosphosulfate sulfotransferase (PAPS reductase)/FAD synthetase
MTRDWADYGIAGHLAIGNPAKAAPYHRVIERRTAAATATIEHFSEAVGKAGCLYLSFGADSLVAYDLARRVWPEIPAVWVNQGPLAEWPDCLALKDRMVANGLPLVEITPDVTLYDWYRLHGIPFACSMNNAEDERLNRALLYDPIQRYQEAAGIRGYIWGLRWRGEGKHRAFVRMSVPCRGHE